MGLSNGKYLAQGPQKEDEKDKLKLGHQVRPMMELT